jgi:hypothetical protein
MDGDNAACVQVQEELRRNGLEFRLMAVNPRQPRRMLDNNA